MNLIDWYRRRSLEKAELRLADLEDYRERWGWSLKPSEWNRLDKRIRRAKRRVGAS